MLQALKQLRETPGLFDVKDQLKTHVYARSQDAFRSGHAARDAITDPGALRRHVAAMRARGSSPI